MNTRDLIEKLKGLSLVISGDEMQERVGVVVVNTIAGGDEVTRGTKVRLFQDGKATAGDAIGQYSTNPIRMAVPGAFLGLPKRTGRGIGGRKKKKNGDGYKTRYYAGGYRDFRDDVNRQNGYVDLNLTSSMQTAYRAGFLADGRAAVGFINKEAAEIMEGHEKRYNKIIATPSDSEIKAGLQKGVEEVLLIISEKL